ncbi:MAG: RHS repeat-associated core domain-containing protein [Oscillospiraceae bacterium]|nr:RHS repeat-associated core domain-containing protein [Oscillospiraceae bacterium]
MDKETQLYYLQSRYYNPEIGRFLNADSFVSTGQGITGYNMFAYCNNNPVSMADTTGQLPFFIVTAAIGAVVGAVVGGVVAAKNGGNVWAGIGIGAAVGGLVGVGFGAAAGVMLAGSAYAFISNATFNASTSVFWNCEMPVLLRKVGHIVEIIIEVF